MTNTELWEKLYAETSDEPAQDENSAEVKKRGPASAGSWSDIYAKAGDE